jgi:hypothetical protein
VLRLDLGRLAGPLLVDLCLLEGLLLELGPELAARERLPLLLFYGDLSSGVPVFEGLEDPLYKLAENVVDPTAEEDIDEVDLLAVFFFEPILILALDDILAPYVHVDILTHDFRVQVPPLIYPHVVLRVLARVVHELKYQQLREPNQPCRPRRRYRRAEKVLVLQRRDLHAPFDGEVGASPTALEKGEKLKRLTVLVLYVVSQTCLSLLAMLGHLFLQLGHKQYCLLEVAVVVQAAGADPEEYLETLVGATATVKN